VRTTSRVSPAIVGMLPAAMAVATIFYTMVSVLATSMIDDLQITRAELGWVVTVFSVVAALISPTIGGVADRLGAKRAMLWVFLFVSLGFLLLSRATALPWVMGSVVVIAVGQAMSNPSTNKMIALQIPAGRRGLITGIKQSGVQMGTFVGGLAFPALAVAGGWRVAPAAIGFTGLALLALAAATLPTTEPGLATARADRPPLPPGTNWITLYAFLMGAGGSPIFSFLPLYAQEAVGVSESYAGLLIAIGGLVGLTARIAWSVIAERRHSSGPMAAIAALAVISIALTMLAEPWGVAVLWLATVAAYLSMSAWNSVAMLTVITTAGPRGAGRASGVVLMGFLAGLAASPPLFGWSVDRLGTYQPGLAATGILFALGLITVLIWRRQVTSRGELGRPLP